MLPFGGFLIALFVGWYLKRAVSVNELTNYGMLKASYLPIYMVIIKYIAPVAIAFIFMNELGWLP